MQKKIKYIISFNLLLICFQSFSQKEKIIGFWQVEQVEIGEENMTPVAKWFKINANGNYQSGNGWLQSGQGKWVYDSKNKLYSAIDSLDVLDEFGAFSVLFDNENMIWKREEEGMTVKVTLQPIIKLPMSPADYLKGIWDLVEISKNKKSILNDFDKNNKHKLFIRWDRIYINFSPEGKKLTGYWHIHGHKSQITFLPHNKNENPETWKIEVNKKELIMKGISDSNKTIYKKYLRRNSF